MRKPLSFPLVAILAFCTVLLFVLILFWSSSAHKQATIPSLPDDSLGSVTDTENREYLRVEITPQNVQDVIAALSRPANYYIETKSELYYDGRSSTYLRRKWVRGDVSRVDLFQTDSTVSLHVLYSGGYAYFWRPGSTRYTRLPAGKFTADEIQMMMVYEDILALDAADILDAKLVSLNDETCIYVEVAKKDLAYTERYWVSVSSGLLRLGQTLKDQAVIYSVQTLELNTQTPDDATFALPGTMA